MSSTNPEQTAEFDIARLMELLVGSDRDAILVELQSRVPDLPELTQLAFDGMPDVYSPALARGDGGTFAYRIALPDEIIERTVVMDGATCQVLEGGVEPNVTLRMTLVAFLQVSFGVVNGIDAYIDGALEIEGDLQLAGRMQEWFDRSALTAVDSDVGAAAPEVWAAPVVSHLTPADAAVPAPLLKMEAAVTRRTIEIGNHGRPVVLIFQRRGRVESAGVLTRATRMRYPSDGQVTIARVVDISRVPIGFRFVAHRKLAAAFATAKEQLLPGLDPSEHIVILPDFGARTRKAYGIDSVEEAPKTVLVDSAGRVRFSSVGADAETLVPAAVAELIAEEDGAR